MSSKEKKYMQDEPRFQERRRKADWITKMAAILSFISWVVVFMVWVFLDQASPERGTIFNSWFGVAVRDHWDETFFPLVFGLLLASLSLCIIALIFNKLRKRRKTDRYRKSIIIIGAITIVGIILFVTRFGFSVF